MKSQWLQIFGVKLKQRWQQRSWCQDDKWISGGWWMQMTIMLIFTSPTMVLQFSNFCEGTTKPLKNLFKTGIFWERKKSFCFKNRIFRKLRPFQKQLMRETKDLFEKFRCPPGMTTTSKGVYHLYKTLIQHHFSKEQFDKI